MAKRLKILLGIRSQEQREVLRKLFQGQKDMAVVGEVYDSVEILLAVADTEADIIFLDLLDSDVDPGICSHLLIEFPDIIVFALPKDRKHVVTYRSSINKQEIETESDDRILWAIRQMSLMDANS